MFAGVTSSQLANLIVELAEPWDAACESDLQVRRGHTRLRSRGAGSDHHLVFTAGAGDVGETTSRSTKRGARRPVRMFPANDR